MSEEETTSTVTEEVQDEQPDHGKIIAESKAYRHRAQDAEAKIAKYEADAKAAKEAKLAEEGKLQELIDLQKGELETANAKASEWDDYQSARKDSILKTLTEEQAAKYKGLDLSTLESIANDLKPAGGGNSPSDRPGQRQGAKIFDGHENLRSWAAFAAQGTKEDKLRFKNRKGDYPA